MNRLERLDVFVEHLKTTDWYMRHPAHRAVLAQATGHNELITAYKIFLSFHVAQNQCTPTDEIITTRDERLMSLRKLLSHDQQQRRPHPAVAETATA